MQEGPPLVFRVDTHDFAKKGDWEVAVVKKGAPTRAEVCSFTRCAALRDLFVQRLRFGAQTGDDEGLTPLLWPCAGDLRYMLSGPMPRLPRELREELTKAVEGGGALSLSDGETALWARLRAALGC